MPLDQVEVDHWEYDEEGRPLPVEKEMSFVEHLEELRWHVVRALIAIALCGIFFFIFRKWFFREILFGPLFDDFWSYAVFCKIGFCMSAPAVSLQALEVGEQFITAVKMSFVGGFVVAFPYVFYEVWSFVRPGLYPEEQKATQWVIFICSVLFFIGVVFGFFVVAPFGFNFLLNFDVGEMVENNLKMSSAIGYTTMFTLPAALIFELPVVVYFLARFGLVTAEGMRKYRRHSIIGILILASILTPPDVVTQVLIAVPLYALYEVSILVAKRAERLYQQDLD